MTAGGTTDADDWQAVREAVQARVRELRTSRAELARQSGLSETTIRYIGTTGRTNRVALVAISTVLRWRYDHLTNILRGGPEKNARFTSAAVNLSRSLHAEAGPLRRQACNRAEAALATGTPRQLKSGTAISDLPSPDNIDADYSPQYVKLARIVRDEITSGVLGRFSAVRASDLVEEYSVSTQVAYATLGMLAANGYVGRPDNSRYYQVSWDAVHD